MIAPPAPCGWPARPEGRRRGEPAAAAPSSGCRVGAVGDEQLHRHQVGAVGGAPERRRAGGVGEAAVAVAATGVDEIPGMRRDAVIRRSRPCRAAPASPRGRCASAAPSPAAAGSACAAATCVLTAAHSGDTPLFFAVDVRIGAALDQQHRHVELAVDDRGQQRAGAVAGAGLVDVGAAVEQRRRPLRGSPGAPRAAAPSCRPWSRPAD